MAKPEKIVSTGFGIFAMCLTAGIVLIFGIIFSVEYESSCVTNEQTGKVACSTKSAWKGWSGVPVQSLAGAIGTAGGAYAAYRAGRRQSQSNEPMEE